jgi:vacuolar-type H+-ATPase subunit I/STV1
LGESWLMEDFEEKFIKPIINASYPGTLAALSLTVLQVTGLHNENAPSNLLKFTLLLGATAFLLSAFSVFFYSIYPTRKKLWTTTAVMFLLGLFCLITSVLLLFII